MPPGGGSAAPARWKHSQRDTEADEGCPETVEDALRSAHRFYETAGLTIGHRKTVRLVRACFATRTVNQTFGEWVISYADPTGEEAMRNVLRSRGY